MGVGLVIYLVGVSEEILMSLIAGISRVKRN